MSFWLTSAYFGLLLAYFGLLRLTSPKSQQPARGIHIGLRRTCSLPKNMKEKSLLVSASLNSKEPMISEFPSRGFQDDKVKSNGDLRKVVLKFCSRMVRSIFA